MLAAPTIATHGTPEQKAELIPPILDGTVAWCQLFSEPGAGSDLAGLQTKAVKDGDEWIVTGQKVWTSGGQHADKGMLIARTNPEAPKHQGITYFVFDMHQPGVEVRPLREMTGRALFNEVFFDEARVRDADILGDLNNGWARRQHHAGGRAGEPRRPAVPRASASPSPAPSPSSSTGGSATSSCGRRRDRPTRSARARSGSSPRWPARSACSTTRRCARDWPSCTR